MTSHDQTAPAAARRRRAPAMAAEQRRELIIAAATPLLLRDGTRMRTSEVAAAAGIAEGTVFRAFGDKDELIAACVARAMSPDRQLKQLAQIPPELPLPDRLVRVAEIGTEHLETVTALLQTLRASGADPRRFTGPPPRPGSPEPGPAEAAPPGTAPPGTAPDHGPPGAGRTDPVRQLTAAVAEVLGPDAAELKLPAVQAARTFLGLLFVNGSQARLWAQQGLPAAELVDLFLHGIARPATRPQHRSRKGLRP